MKRVAVPHAPGSSADPEPDPNPRFRGTAFTWEVTGMMTVQMLPS